MQPVYRTAKLMMERLKAGAGFGEFNTLRGNFATELSIIRDRMNTGASTNEPLRKYYAAYQNVLELYSFAASAWEHEISMDQCVGPAPTHSDWSKEAKTLNMGQIMAEVRAFNAFDERFHACWEKYEKIGVMLSEQAKSPRINCPEFDNRLGCVFKKAETQLTSAEALLLKR
jgi:hypothetical protein